MIIVGILLTKLLLGKSPCINEGKKKKKNTYLSNVCKHSHGRKVICKYLYHPNSVDENQMQHNIRRPRRQKWIPPDRRANRYRLQMHTTRKQYIKYSNNAYSRTRGKGCEAAATASRGLAAETWINGRLRRRAAAAWAAAAPNSVLVVLSITGDERRSTADKANVRTPAITFNWSTDEAC